MDSFPADHPLASALAERGYTTPTPVQTAVLSAAADDDLLVSAQTGSGKTVAYGLAIADSLLAGAQALGAAGQPLALIVAPTRELALQVERELAWLYQPAGVGVLSCVGGMDPRAEQRALARGAHIVVGTPGRLRDHLERGALRVGALAALVLDEADEMLDLGFREDLEFILEATPAERRTLLFSATLPKSIVGLAKRYQQDAVRINVSAGAQGHADIEYRAVRIADDQTEPAVVNLLRFFDSPTTMIFCNTRDAVRRLQATLQERGFAAVALSGELGQNERNQALQALRDGQARVCVATDVAARGIDLPSLDLVIHAELPQNAETMQHRSGRTGRAGRKGVSALLVPPARRRRAEMLLRSAHLDAVWEAAPAAAEIRQRDRQRLLDEPFAGLAPDVEDQAMVQTLLAGRTPEEIAAALVRLYRSRLPAPEEVTDPGQGRVKPADRPRPDARPDARHGGGHDRGHDREHAEPESAGLWFRLNIGRKKNADPRWLIPLICRQGGITKQEIGAIRIFERETRFEIDPSVGTRFLAAVRAVERADAAIEPMGEVLPFAATDDRPARRPRKGAPNRPPAKPYRRDKPAGRDTAKRREGRA